MFFVLDFENGLMKLVFVNSIYINVFFCFFILVYFVCIFKDIKLIKYCVYIWFLFDIFCFFI